MSLEIALTRLYHQQLLDPQFNSPKQLVKHMGAIQAQDYFMAKWAIGCRLNNATEESVEKAIDKGEVLRTHVLRPTWHIVPAEDIKWMLALTAPQIQKAADYMNKHLDLTPAIFKKTNKLIEKHLRGTNLTREEIMAIVRKAGIMVDTLRAAHIMLEAELKGIICSGPMRGRQFTYGLIDERAKKQNHLNKEESLAELARRYFTSHGPASLEDFKWWSGLSGPDARAALGLVRNTFHSEVVNEREYFFVTNKKPEPRPSILFLPAFDEFMVSYKDRSASLESKFTRSSVTINGIFKPIIVVNGKVVGIWKKTSKNGVTSIEPVFFKKAYRLKKAEMKEALKPYENYLGSNIRVG